MTEPGFDYRSLSVDERLELVGDIWDSIADEANTNPDLLPLSDAERAELDRRVAALDANPATGIPMDDVLEGIRARLRDR
jgi:putative addiction module component (TIGR02574 family)